MASERQGWTEWPAQGEQEGSGCPEGVSDSLVLSAASCCAPAVAERE